MVIVTGGGGVTIGWWGYGEDAALGRCLLIWGLLAVLGRRLVGELAVVGLAMVIVGKRCAGEECAQNGARGGYKKGDDGVWGDERRGESRGAPA